ncbi:hypothetical protein [Christiangramia aquimixticola]|uniref:hypothetical protein n=1 Tax=Christiangramia aquimixticola TaxID=1697558 RepID=UPI003AA984A2
MDNQYIEFKRERELGEIISITFKFIRENYKTAFKLFIRLVGPAFLLLIAAISYYSWTTLGSSFLEAGGLNMSNFIISGATLFIAYLLYYTSMTGTINHMIQSYINNNGKIIDAEVRAGLKEDFGKIFLLTLLSGILIFAGFIFFVIPGIYLMVPLSLVTAILVFRRKGVMDSIGDSFQLIKDNWWITFASILVISLIVYLVGLIFQLPALFYIFIKGITMATEGAANDPSQVFGTGYVIINTISSAIQYIIYSITPIGLAFVYFNLNEKKNFTGAHETIQNLGNNH